jgi:hypothetical protein
MNRLCLLAVLLSVPVLCAPSLRVSDTGLVSLDDGRPLLSAALNMHAPGWAPASIANATARAVREDQTVTGSLPLPAPCTGELRYTVAMAPQADGGRIDYTAQFSEATEIQGAYVSFFLPCERFEGHAVTMYPAATKGMLPAADQANSLSSAGSGFSVDLGDGSALVVAASSPSYIMLQDNRRYNVSQYEFRFTLFGEGKVLPGLLARRGFRVAVVPVAEAQKVVQDMAPAISFDPAKPYALMLATGQFSIGTRDEPLASVGVAIHGPGWSYNAQDKGSVALSGDVRTRTAVGTLPVPGATGAVMELAQTAEAREDGALGLRYHLRFPEAVRLNGYQVSFNLRLKPYSGETIHLETPDGGKDVVIGKELGENHLFNGKVSKLTVAAGKPEGFTLTVDQPSTLLVQDNRGWGGSDIELRFNFLRAEAGAEVPAGETVDRQFVFALNSPLQVILDESAAVSRTDTSDWIAYTLPWDSCPVDVSFLNHKPAGKYGFVTVRDGKFVLSDTGQEIRFWGTCFSAGANFPSHEQAEKIARRLAQFGVNIVRTHHADAQWAERCFFPKDSPDTRRFDAENLDRFDYLMYCLKREGIYIYLDQLVNRYFRAGDGVDAVDQLGACGKPYSNFDPKLIELQKEFSRNLWSHVNPYTKLAYKDDPAVALMEFANENDLFAQQVTLEPYRTRFEAMYRDWAGRNGVTLPEGKIDFTVRTDSLMRFLVEVQRNYYLEMQRYLRDEVGVRVPMTGSNWTQGGGLLAALRDMPFTDSHTYWNHPARDGAVNNNAMVGSSGTVFGGLAFNRMAGKPFFASEWDEPWPNEWRAELPVWVAGISALQDWNGLTVYTYRHSSQVPIDRISGAFETFNDPARFGLFPNAALIFRRGDLKPATQTVGVAIPLDLAASAASPTPWASSAYGALVETQRIESVLAAAPTGYDRVVRPSDKITAEALRRAEGGRIWRDVNRKVGAIDTPLSQAVYGALSEAGELSTADMRVTSPSRFGTIALGSLTDAPITRSERLLLTAVGRAENTGFAYNILRTKKANDGSGPILTDGIRGNISIATTQPDMEVWAVSAEGKLSEQVPTRYENGKLSFEIGPQWKTIYYQLFVPEPP